MVKIINSGTNNTVLNRYRALDNQLVAYEHGSLWFSHIYMNDRTLVLYKCL